MYQNHALCLVITNILYLLACGDDPVDTNDDDAKGTSSDSGIAYEASTIPDSSEWIDAALETGIVSNSDQHFEQRDSSASSEAALDIGAAQTSYQGFEEVYITTGDDDPVDVCRIRYELRAVGEPSSACAECSWDVLIERRNPSVIVDVDHACANSDLALDAAGVAAFEGEPVEYGYVDEFMGHSNVLVRLNRDRGTWEAVTFANWSETTGDLFYDRRDGFCGYGGDGPSFENQGICGLYGEAVVSD